MLESVRLSLRVLNAAQLGAVAAVVLLLAWAGAVVSGTGPVADEQRQVLVSAARAFAEAVDADLARAVSDARGAALLLRPDDPGLSDAQRSVLLKDLLRHAPRYRDAALVGPAGEIRASSDPERIGRQVPPRQAWLGRMRGAQVLLWAGEAGADAAVEIVLPLGATERADWLQLRLGPAFLTEPAGRAGRAFGLSGSVSFAVAGADGRLLGGSPGPLPAGSVTASVPVRGGADLASPGWVVTAATPDAAPARLAPSPAAAGIGLLAVLAAAGLGYALGGRAAEPLRRWVQDADAVSAEPVSRVREIAALASAMAGRRESADARLSQAGTGLDRVRERLRTFEAMSGWTCWEIDPRTHQVVWSDSDQAGIAASSDRTAALSELAARFEPADRPLLTLVLDAAQRADGPHDVVLRTRADGPEPGRRILVRVLRGVAGAPRIHALSREIGDGEVQDPAAGANERRRNLVLRQVADGIVHDFNDVLTVVLANLGILRRRPGLDEAQGRLVDGALAGARRGAALTRCMLTLMRGGAEADGSREGDVSGTCDAAATAAGALAFLQANVLRDVPVMNRMPEDLPEVLCGERALEVVLLNVAFHIHDQRLHGFAIGAATHEAEAGTSFGLPPGSYLRLLLASGRRPPGVQPRVDGVAALATVAGLLDRIGAGWRLESDGTGAESFLAEIWLRAAPPRSEKVGRAMPREDGHEIGQESGREQGRAGLRILLVEGDSLVRDSLAATLADLGHTVVAAASGGHALDLLGESAAYDAMIADQSMPVMTGLQLAATVVERHPGIRVILTSPHGQLPAAARRFLRLDKPFHRRDLVAVLGMAATRAA